MNKYLIVIEATETGYSAYSPDLPGCISTGASRDGLGEEGQPVPEPIHIPRMSNCLFKIKTSPSPETFRFSSFTFLSSNFFYK
jgi:hypothetical protein